jgi:hypothetical protein
MGVVQEPRRRRGFARGTPPASKRRLTMKKDRLEWILSGLNQYKLTEREDQLVKSAEQDFNQKNMLTEQQEGRLENLYKDKSRFIPNKTYFTPRESSGPKKTRVHRPRVKVFS